jgi:hypothetical protein
MDDYIGGRFSSTSAVGGAVLSLAFGPEVFAQFLDGASEEDKLSLNKNMLENPEMLDALIGVYERNVLGYPATAVLPYFHAVAETCRENDQSCHDCHKCIQCTDSDTFSCKTVITTNIASEDLHGCNSET